MELCSKENLCFSNNSSLEEEMTDITKKLTDRERELLDHQNSRPLSEFKIESFEKDAQKHWDLFYKRNCERFFKNRYWSLKVIGEIARNFDGGKNKSLLEIGCGVGNLIYPLLEDDLFVKIYACDFSRRAIELVKANPRYLADLDILGRVYRNDMIFI